MPAATNLMLGVLMGNLLSCARVDSIWYSAILNNVPVKALKSMITAMQRADAEAFYKGWGKAPFQFDLYLIAATVLILLSLLGGAIQFPSKRIANILSLLVFGGAVGVHMLLTRPLISQVMSYKTRTINESNGLLKDIALYNAITAIAILLVTLIQVGLDESDEQASTHSRPKKKQSSAKSD